MAHRAALLCRRAARGRCALRLCLAASPGPRAVLEGSQVPGLRSRDAACRPVSGNPLVDDRHRHRHSQPWFVPEAFSSRRISLRASLFERCGLSAEGRTKGRRVDLAGATELITDLLDEVLVDQEGSLSVADDPTSARARPARSQVATERASGFSLRLVRRERKITSQAFYFFFTS